MVQEQRLALDRLRPVDWLILGYTGVTTALTIMRLGQRPGIGWLLLANALLVLLVMLLAHRKDPTGLLREVYPILLLLGLYGALDVLNGAGAARVYDVVVMEWEESLFGGQVARNWWRNDPSQVWSTILHAAYLSYYVIVPLPVALFAWQRRPLALRRTVLAIMASFIACYLVFLSFPVAGPYYLFDRPTSEFTGNWAAAAVYRILEGGSSYGAAFPSSHVAATVAAAGVAWLHERRLGALLLLPTALLAVGVVYTQMHYAVDAVAGAAVGLAAVAAAFHLEKGPPEM